MGNGLPKLSSCFCGSCSGGGAKGTGSLYDSVAVISDPYDENLGHSFCYVRPDPSAEFGGAATKVHDQSEETTTFRSISGAALSANTSTPLSTSALLLLPSEMTWPAAAAFESSTSFSSVPLQPVPRFASGPLSGPLADRGFLSGPLERGFLSGPLDQRSAAVFSGPLDPPKDSTTTTSSSSLRRSLSHGGPQIRRRPRHRPPIAPLFRGISKAFAAAISKRPRQKESDYSSTGSSNAVSSTDRTSVGGEDSDSFYSVNNGNNLQWAQGKAGEDRVHVVVSEERGWVFVGIYDGFNGPDATDYLLSNLYSAVHRELKGLLWDDKLDGTTNEPSDEIPVEYTTPPVSDGCCREGRQRRRRKSRGVARRWKCEWDRERLNLERRLKKQLSRSSSGFCGSVNYSEVLKALSLALRKTEDAYLDIADKMVSENPELALMGSCVLVMLMKGEDVYLMNVGDSRAVLGQKAEKQDLGMINEEILNDGVSVNGGLHNLAAVQLTLDHSTCMEEEVRRIRAMHSDDASAIINGRVKGSLKVTRAFGAGFLKQPKWNNALLEMFRIDYVGSSPYITCSPFLYHHRLGMRDKFLILSSDGLYQYFTNEEAVTEVELFIDTCPEGDPAQHLVEEVLFRAAEKAGMDFHELLEIPQGDRRRYHDDVSVIVISLEGRIWRSCV